MLTAKAQPTSHVAHTLRGRLSAASAVVLLAIGMLFSATATAAAARPADGSGDGNWPWPVLGEVITSYKNASNRYLAGQHRGIDIAAPAGRPVLAVVAGRVSFAGRLPDGGRAVTVKSSDGRWLVSGLHLTTIAVARGQRVRLGQQIGTVGLSGRRSASAPHLHLSVRHAESRAYVDPMTLLGAKRLATAAFAPRPRVHALERPASKQSQSVRAQTTGDETPASRHGVQGRRISAGHSAGDRARVGHAARTVSRVAPPPIPVEQPALVDRAVAAPREEAPRESVTQPATVEQKPIVAAPRRLLLLAVAAICLVALMLRRRPRTATPPTRAPQPGAELAEVVPLERQLRA
jgi:hypothetical protein